MASKIYRSAKELAQTFKRPFLAQLKQNVWAAQGNKSGVKASVLRLQILCRGTEFEANMKAISFFMRSPPYAEV